MLPQFTHYWVFVGQIKYTHPLSQWTHINTGNFNDKSVNFVLQFYKIKLLFFRAYWISNLFVMSKMELKSLSSIAEIHYGTIWIVLKEFGKDISQNSTACPLLKVYSSINENIV